MTDTKDMPEPVAWRYRVDEGDGWHLLRHWYDAAGMRDDGFETDPLYSSATVTALMAERDAAIARAEAAEIRLKTYEEVDEEVNAKFVRISDNLAKAAIARAERAERLLAEAKMALEPFADIADTEEEVGREDQEDERVLIVQAGGCQIGALDVSHFRAARAIVNKEGGE